MLLSNVPDVYPMTGKHLAFVTQGNDDSHETFAKRLLGLCEEDGYSPGVGTEAFPKWILHINFSVNRLESTYFLSSLKPHILHISSEEIYVSIFFTSKIPALRYGKILNGEHHCEEIRRHLFYNIKK